MKKLDEIKKGEQMYIIDAFNDYTLVIAEVNFVRRAYGRIYANINHPKERNNMRIDAEYNIIESTKGGDVFTAFASIEAAKECIDDWEETELHYLNEANEDEETTTYLTERINNLAKFVRQL